MTNKETKNTIILSKSAVLLLLAEVDVPASRNTPAMRKPLWGVLPVLAKHGFDIVIPEMVSYDTGNILRGGWSINQYFPDLMKGRKPIFSRAENFIRKGLGIYGGEYRKSFLRIAIPDAKDQTPAAAFVRELNTIHASDILDSAKNALIIEMQRTKYKPRMSVNASSNMIHCLSGKAGKVFCLSDDIEQLSALSKMRKKYGNVQEITAVDFFKTIAITAPNILAMAGLHGQSFSDIFKALNDHAYAESSTRIHMVCNFAVNRYHLAQALKSVPEFIAEMPQPKTYDIRPSNRTGADKFRQRYAGWSAASALRL